MEAEWVAPLPLPNLLHPDYYQFPEEQLPISVAARNTWCTMSIKFKNHSFLHIKASICGNLKLCIVGNPIICPGWIRKGILIISQFVEDNIFLLFPKLNERFNLETKKEWKYIQSKHAISHLFSLNACATPTHLNSFHFSKYY